MVNSLLKINGKDYTAQILTPFKIGRHKIWGSDTGRLMSGDMSGTLVGIFPKITVIFSPKNELEYAELTNVLDTAWQSIEYYNPKIRGFTTLGTYTNDYEMVIINTRPFYDTIQVSFVASGKER